MLDGAGLIIVAAGAGSRMGGVRKALVELAGEPLVVHAVRNLRRDAALPTVVACHADDIAPIRELLAADATGIHVVAGGRSRQESVAAGLKVLLELHPDLDLVAVHDAARPLADAALLARVLKAAAETGCAVPGMEIADTVRRVDAAGRAVETPARSDLRAVQTPQAFAARRLASLLNEANASGINVTDEAVLFERAGDPVVVVKGARENHKITTPDDLAWAEALLAAQRRET